MNNQGELPVQNLSRKSQNKIHALFLTPKLQRIKRLELASKLHELVWIKLVRVSGYSIYLAVVLYVII